MYWGVPLQAKKRCGDFRGGENKRVNSRNVRTQNAP